ncbi:UNVERIFIED_ORG: signal transduction histidine kinase [Microbispora rosea subsp. rosea]
MNGISDRIEHAERIAERALSRQRRFAADASHELLTPIAAVRAQLEAARLHPDDVSEAIVSDLLCRRASRRSRRPRERRSTSAGSSQRNSGTGRPTARSRSASPRT